MDNSELLKHSKTWDRSGLFVAILCLLHCLALPFIALLLPFTRSLFNSLFFEAVILVLGVLVGSISFVTTYRKHKNLYPMLLGILGVMFLFVNLIFIKSGALIHSHAHAEATMHSLRVDPMMILGGIFLIAGHLWNIHACHCFCEEDCSHQHEH